jgi:hypothetical protein
MLFEEVLAELSADLPPVVLLTGSPRAALSVVAREAFLAHHVRLSDLRWSQRVDAATARQVVAQAPVQPSGDFLGFVLDISESSEQAQDILLKLAEAPPETCRLILVSSGQMPVIPALASRCKAYQVHEHRGTEPVPDNAAAAAAAAVRAAITRDPGALTEALRSWGERCPCRAGILPHDKGEHYLAALSAWAVSQYRDRDVEPGLQPLVTSRKARAVLQVLCDHPRARPQNAAAAALLLAFLEDS